MRKLTILFAVLTLCVGLWAETQKVSYLYPVYNTEVNPASGIHEWKTGEVEATVVEYTTNRVTWNAGWYVVAGDITLSEGVICKGAVHLILADGSKLTATGIDANETPGIQVSGDGNSLTIYGQNNQSGQLIAKGALAAAGIGGEMEGIGSNITINGGTVTATGGYGGAGIGGGYMGSSSDIFVDTDLTVRADSNNPPTTVIENDGSDLASSLAGKQYVTIMFDLRKYQRDAILEIDAARQGIENVELNNGVIDALAAIPDATTKDEIDRIRNHILPLIQLFKNGKTEGDAAGYARGKEEGKAEGIEQAKAELPTDPEGTAGTAVEITKGDKSVTLINPDKVKYVRIEN